MGTASLFHVRIHTSGGVGQGRDSCRASHRTLVMGPLASHKLCEIIHRGDEAFPLACLVGGCRLSRGLSWGFGVGWRVYQRQAWV